MVTITAPVAYFAFLAAWSTSERIEIHRSWFARISTVLADTPFHHLPSALIMWLSAKSRFFAHISHWGINNTIGSWIFGIIAACAGVSVYLLVDISPYIRYLIPFLLMISLILQGTATYLTRHSSYLQLSRWLSLMDNILVLLVAVAFGYSSLYLITSYDYNIFVDLLFAVMLIAVFLVSAHIQFHVGLTITEILHRAPPSEETEVSISALFIGAGASVLLTISALWLGDLASSGSAPHPTWQLLIVNLICDSMTLVICVMLIRHLNPVFAIPLCVVSSSILAVISMYVGLIGSTQQVNVLEALRTFGAISKDGNRFFIGGAFWMMHSTLIPVMIYVTILLVSLITKTVVSIFSLFAGRAAHPDISPPRLISAVCAIFGFMFAVLTYIADVMRAP